MTGVKKGAENGLADGGTSKSKQGSFVPGNKMYKKEETIRQRIQILKPNSVGVSSLQVREKIRY